MVAVARACETVSDAPAGAGRVHNGSWIIGSFRRADSAVLQPRFLATGALDTAGARVPNTTFSFTFPPFAAVSAIQGRRGTAEMSFNNKSSQPE
jgi:hypothetical protein